MRTHISRQLTALFWRDDDGATAIEYGLIAALVTIILISGLFAFGASMSGLYNSLGNAVNGAAGG